jgi:hypothetical protein
VANENEGILSEFEEFLAAKRESEAQNSADEDYEVEVWNEKGQGARLKRSHAKPFLQSLGIDLDPTTDGDQDGDKNKTKPKGGKAPAAGATGAQATSVKKYFKKP